MQADKDAVAVIVTVCISIVTFVQCSELWLLWHLLRQVHSL